MTDLEKEMAREIEELENAACEAIAIAGVANSKATGGKYPPWHWKEEKMMSHLLKAARHLQTHMLIIQGFKESDGEDHLDNALIRVAMALAKKEAV